MSELLRLTIPGRPVPKGRPRFGQGHAFTPKRTRDYERKIRLAALKAMRGREPTPLPVRVTVEAVYEPPKSPKARAFSIASSRLPYTGRPDIDNLLKAALDGINGVAFADDRQVCEARAVKRYGFEAQLTVIVEEYEY